MQNEISTENHTTSEEKPSIYSFQLGELKDWLEQHGEKAFRAEQIYDWLYKKEPHLLRKCQTFPKDYEISLTNILF